ncbi:hypothetical protein [Pacificoceanicola onchidii]|uniref:hypothetical protein n=1 Tax=Pacificoceanicola onchidii TaxID=2562685 RepID=UPI0010A598A8|nr:hypothetical protein [Pacificoceanicola onchidii]
MKSCLIASLECITLPLYPKINLASKNGADLSSDTDFAKAEEEAAKIDGTEIPEISDLPFELLLGKGRKTTKLVANSGDPSPISGSNRWFDFQFAEPVFLVEVIVDEENYSTFNEFEFRWTLAQGGEGSQEFSKRSNEGYRASINQLVRRVSFKPPKKWLTNTQITRVRLLGFQIDELEDFIRLVAKLDQYKENVSEEARKEIRKAEAANEKAKNIEMHREKLLSEISDSNSKVAELNANIGRLTEQRQGLIEDIASREEAISNLDERSVQVQEIIAERTTERKSLAKSVAELKQELRALEDDVNMFPTEIGGFVSQGGQNIGTYWKLAAVPIALMVLVTGLLVFNAANLTTVYDEGGTAKIWSILLTRIPYVIIATAIITACYKLARVFIAEIMRINQQRLNLSKISIVATDASNTSQEGLDLTDRELYELRTDLKMQLLRDHLKEYLSTDFRYQGRSTNNWTRLLEKRSASAAEEEPDEAVSP